MPSGKQILLHFLQKYSLGVQRHEKTEEISENIRVGLLMHGSTNDEMWQNVDTIEWGAKVNNQEEIYCQGISIKNKSIFLTDLFEHMIWDAEESIPPKVKERFPELTQSEYEAAISIISLLLSSFEWSDHLSKIEQGGKIDTETLEKHLKSYKKKMRLYRENPEAYLGYKEVE